MDENQLLQEIVDILSTWGCVLTEGKCPTYKEMLNGLLERSNRVVGRHRKDEFDKLVAIHGWKSFPVSAWIELIADEPTIDPAALNRKIEKGNKMLKTKMTDFIEVLKKTSTYDYFKKQFGEIFTPLTLVNEMLDKLPSHVWNNPKLLWLDPACGSGNFLLVVKQRLMEGLCKIFPDAKEREQHILENMLHGVDLQVRNVVLASMQLDPEGIYELHLEREDSLKFRFWGKQFDVVVGNPPYHAMSEASKTKTQSMWDKFVKLGFSVLNDNGHIAFVHPSGWRSENKKIFTDAQILKEKQIMYLEIHNEADGNKVFGATTRYDWYVVKNCPIENETIIVDQDGVSTKADLRKISFIPSSMINKVFSSLAKEGEDRVTILHSFSAYESRKSYIKETKQDEFIYPVVYSTPVESPTIWYSSTNENGHFGVPKVIFNPCRPIGFVVDEKGEYGMSQFCVGIVGDSTYLKIVVDVIKNQKTNGFSEFMEACHFTDKIFNKEVISLFRKYFWREFL